MNVAGVFSTYRLKPFVDSRWSNNLPGEATITCGFLPKAIACCMLSMPPTMRAHRSDIREPRASNACWIWTASSLVGASTRANRGCGFSRSDCRIGRANAAVFPEPVSAIPIMSRPESARGIACCWIGVGFLYPRRSQASHRESTTPYTSLEKEQEQYGIAYQFLECFWQGFLLLPRGIVQSRRLGLRRRR